MGQFEERPYRKSILHEIASRTVERICGESKHWTYPRFREVLIRRGIDNVYIPAPYRAESIDLGHLNTHTKELQARSDREGVEFARTFFVDIEQRRFLSGRISRGTPLEVVLDWRRQAGREEWQRRSLATHVHVRALLDRKGINPFGDRDFRAFILDPEPVADIISMGDYTVMVVKTSVTPNRPSLRVVDELTLGIAQEYQAPGSNQWKNTTEAIRANKEICLALGLMLYLGKTGEPLKRVPLVKQR